MPSFHLFGGAMSYIISQKKLFIVIIGVAVTILFYYLLLGDINKRESEYFHGRISKNDRKAILMWTEFFGSSDLTNLQCKSLNCDITNNKSLLSSSDALIFHFSDINLTNLPERAFPLQKFVYFTMEAPFSTDSKITPSNYFNWVMSYNKKSDVLFQYGSKWINFTEGMNVTRLDYAYNKILPTKKNKGVIGFISNCATNSAREKIIDKLSKYIKMDIYGKCAKDEKKKLICPPNIRECEKNLITSYYFYIALENSICDDYVTEKYWSRYMYNSVPIVMKRSIYVNIGIPNSSFIAIDDYKNSKEMSEHMKYLMNNPEEYIKYFSYRKENIMVMEWDEFSLVNGVCALCSKLNNFKEMMINEKIPDVSKLYKKINNCTTLKAAHNFADEW
uniref:Fucosyltransferase n=1 Tax=Parastrongyloides trichosuri TaxID=131310 RepID=A0A0N4ZC06_PARTI